MKFVNSRSSYVPGARVAGIVYGTLPLAVPVVYRQLMREVYWSDAPVGYRPIQSVDVGEPMLLQVAVTVPPAAMLDGVTLRLAVTGGDAVTVKVLLVPIRL